MCALHFTLCFVVELSAVLWPSRAIVDDRITGILSALIFQEKTQNEPPLTDRLQTAMAQVGNDSIAVYMVPWYVSAVNS